MSYSHLIVGGGPAGCVLANRLTACPTTKVALLEAGPDTPPDAVPADIASSYAGRAVMNPDYFWDGLRVQLCGPTGDHTALSTRYEQARVMGGGSSVNGQVITRGAPADYDLWEEAGARGWGWKSVLPYFIRAERDLDFSSDLHGRDGPIPVRRIARSQWDKFAEAVASELEKRQFRAIPDLNSVFAEGFGGVPINNLDGRRISAADAYLDWQTRARPNLDIREKTEVTRILFDGRRAIGVETSGPRGVERIEARETILAAGAIFSPTLLMRSGVGPAALLRSLRIATVVDLAFVGRNLQEHPAIHISAYLRRGARFNRATGRHNCLYARYASGVLGPNEPDMLMNIASRSAWHAVGQRLGTIQVYVLRPFSRGAVRLRSAAATDTPDVMFNLLSDSRDLARLMEGFKRAAAVMRSENVSRLALDPFPTRYSDRVRRAGRVTLGNYLATSALGIALDLPSPIRRAVTNKWINEAPSLEQLLRDDAALEDHVRRSVSGVWHPTGTCRMGDPDDPSSVTDRCGKVLGVDSLRIADASLMPEIPRCNTHMPTLMLAERLADLIISEHRQATQ